MNAPGFPIHKLKAKRCKACKQMFQPFRPLQAVCGTECAHQQAIDNRLKLGRAYEAQLRKETRSKREALKTRRDYINEAQRAFNAFIRARDSRSLCICCDKPLGSGEVGGAFDCGHYRSVGSAPHLRFNEKNAHGQRKQCNRWGAGRAVDYRLGLIKRIGLEAVEALEADQEPRKHSIEELKALTALYRAKLKALKEAT